MFVKSYLNVAGAPADLAVAAQRATQWIPAKGARMVVFYWRATNGQSPTTNNGLESSNGEPPVAGAAIGSANTIGMTPSNFAQPVPVSASLNIGNGVGFVCQMSTTGGFPNPPLIMNRYVRMFMTGVGATITLLECYRADVFYDGDREPNTGFAVPDVAV